MKYFHLFFTGWFAVFVVIDIMQRRWVLIAFMALVGIFNLLLAIAFIREEKNEPKWPL